MANPNTFTIDVSWRVLLRDLDLSPEDILRRAGLPRDLFGREKTALKTDEYFRLWQGIQDEAADPRMPLRFAEILSVEIFDPSLFAALCSPDLNIALGRIAHYKRLVMPMTMRVDIGASATSLSLDWTEAVEEAPSALLTMELVFFTQLARIATRMRISPIDVRSPRPPQPEAEYAEYFGRKVRHGDRPSLSFSSEDATRPFLTANEKMWEYFEPELQKRLSCLDGKATTTERVRGALLELLPSGEASLSTVSKKLGTSTRTLHRRLEQEGQSFQVVLNATREELAKHYLRSSSYSGAEISFLLGYDDPNSFFRAFHGWTGSTPEQTRSELRN